MQQDLYSDGIGEITITSAIVRIDMMSLSATEKDGQGQPMPVFRQRIIMPIEAFANAADLVQKALNGLIEAGAVHRGPPPVKKLNGEERLRETATVNSSPNFY